MGRLLFAALFIAGGIGHFAAPDFYLRIMPPYLPEPRALVAISGAAELLLGVLLLARRTRALAAWGLIALLIAVFPANWYMWQHAERFGPAWVLLLRLPLQALLIAWAYRYARPAADRAGGEVPRAAGLGLLVVGLLAVGVAGCGIWGASLERLKNGSLARAKSPSGQPITVYFAVSEETLAPGTVVKVVSDDEGTVHQLDRKVIVGFSQGPHEGLAGLVRRSDLEPDR